MLPLVLLYRYFNAFIIAVGKPEGKRLFETPRHNGKTVLSRVRGMACDYRRGLDW
jgi:hypothetical protein